MKNKSKIILWWTPSVVVALIIGMGAILKLADLPQFVEVYWKIGLLPYMNILGVAELFLSHGTFFIIPGVILTLVWIAAYLRDASVVISNKNQVNKPTTSTIL